VVETGKDPIESLPVSRKGEIIVTENNALNTPDPTDSLDIQLKKQD